MEKETKKGAIQLLVLGENEMAIKLDAAASKGKEVVVIKGAYQPISGPELAETCCDGLCCDGLKGGSEVFKVITTEKIEEGRRVIQRIRKQQR